jgi:sigma-B regulation protein RsbU (phosphoserine phosphatase)
VRDSAHRLGGGLPLVQSTKFSLSADLEQVVTELQMTWPDRVIQKNITITCPVHCDNSRIGQLLSNLLGNAVAHGAPDQSIRMYAFASRETFELSVFNAGPPIPPASLGQLFQPFFRGAVRPSQQGLGLGLYIVSEIARAQGGQ